MSLNKTRRGLRWIALFASGTGLLVACGSRTGLDYGPPKPPPPECYVAADCPDFGDFCKPVICAPLDDMPDAGPSEVAKTGGQCKKAVPVDCDDHDPCTADTCDPGTGLCSYALATLDLDNDGYRGPLPGTIAGQPGSCGDDCDDTNAKAHPGGIEVCDGVDNDCNGIIDDNAGYIPLDDAPVRISGDIAPAGPGGLAYSGNVYASVYTGTSSGFDVYVSMLDPTGKTITPPGETQFTIVNADASGGPVTWIGDRFGLAWQDRRTGDYEIFVSILGEDGAKKFPDTQITSAPGFSVNPALAWNKNEFLVVWQDDRDGLFNLYAQRVSPDSKPIGENLALTDAGSTGLGNESPSIAVGAKGVGISWFVGDALNKLVQFQVFSPDLTTTITPPILLTDGSTKTRSPTVVWNKDRYVISWFDITAPSKAIYATAVDESGVIVVPTKAISNPGPFRSRYPYLRPLGDRLLAVYSDDRDQNDGYELYSRMISADLEPLSPEQRLTNAKKDSIYPIPAFGPEGNVGILFRDDRLQEQDVWFTRLGCVTSPNPP
ncbi:MAG: MopE-related protein [Byssovorax sp.]